MLKRLKEFFLLLDFRRSKWLTIPIILIVLMLGLMFYYDYEPDLFDVRQHAEENARKHGHDIKTGYLTVVTLQEVTRIMLEKRGWLSLQ